MKLGIGTSETSKTGKLQPNLKTQFFPIVRQGGNVNVDIFKFLPNQYGVSNFRAGLLNCDLAYSQSVRPVKI